MKKVNLSGKAIYRMHIIEASASRLVFDVENVSTMRYFFMPILHPGDLQSMYFLDRESDHVWSYYSIMRTGKNANGLSREMRLLPSIGQLRSIAILSEFQPHKSLRGLDEESRAR